MLRHRAEIPANAPFGPAPERISALMIGIGSAPGIAPHGPRRRGTSAPIVNLLLVNFLFSMPRRHHHTTTSLEETPIDPTLPLHPDRAPADPNPFRWAGGSWQPRLISRQFEAALQAGHRGRCMASPAIPVESIWSGVDMISVKSGPSSSSVVLLFCYRCDRREASHRMTCGRIKRCSSLAAHAAIGRPIPPLHFGRSAAFALPLPQ